mgnify:CR=1 FL=1
MYNYCKEVNENENFNEIEIINDIETIDDKQLSVKVPAGTQVGEKLRLRGHGMPTRRVGSFGDLYIDVAIHIPEKLTEKQKKILAEFADTKTGKKGWF